MGRVADAAGDLALRIVDSLIRRVRTAVVARVQSYDPATQTASALPLVGEQLPDGRELQPVELGRLPVMHAGTAKRGITFGLEQGDTGVMLVRHRSHAEIDSGATGPATPQDSARCQVGHGVFLPGYVSRATGRPSSQRRADGALVIYLHGSEPVYVGVSTASIDVARADRVDAQLQQIRDLLTTWVPVPNDGGLALQVAALALWPPLPAPQPSSVASTRIKVDA